MDAAARLDISYILDALGAEINKINARNGFNVTKPEDWDATPYKIPAILALIHSEVSEALESYRGDGGPSNPNFAEELADIMIRVLDLAHGLKIDLGSAILNKLEKNRTRGYRHGGKKV